MSKHETWRTRRFWNDNPGLLIEEYMLVNRSANSSRRLLDSLIVLGETNKHQTGGSYNIEGKDVIIIQTKATQLGMSLLGQAYFSQRLVEQLRPKSIRNVAICRASDETLEPLAREAGIEVVVITDP